MVKPSDSPKPGITRLALLRLVTSVFMEGPYYNFF
jgi:hypothetical protein